jgi:hypothetical protein
MTEGRVMLTWRFESECLDAVNAALKTFPDRYQQLCLMPERTPNSVEFSVEVEFDYAEQVAQQVSIDIMRLARERDLPGEPVSVDVTDDEFFCSWSLDVTGTIVVETP